MHFRVSLALGWIAASATPALSQESNLWPLYAIFASPVAFIITLVVFLVARRRARAAAA